MATYGYRNPEDYLAVKYREQISSIFTEPDFDYSSGRSFTHYYCYTKDGATIDGHTLSEFVSKVKAYFNKES